MVAVLHFFKRRSTLSKYVLQKMLELLDDGSWIIRQSQVSENIRYRNPGNPLGKKHPVRPHSSLWIPHHQDHHYHHWCRPPTCLLSSWCRLIRFICPSVWLKSASMLFRPAHSHKRSCLTMWTLSHLLLYLLLFVSDVLNVCWICWCQWVKCSWSDTMKAINVVMLKVMTIDQEGCKW